MDKKPNSSSPELKKLAFEQAKYYFKRGTSKFTAKNYKSAIEDFNKAIELNSNDAQIYEKLGESKIYLREYESAIDAFDKAIEAKPNNEVAYYYRGIAKMNLKRDDASDDFDKVIELNPNDAKAYEMRGITYIYEEVDRLAIEDFSKAIEINPHSALGYNKRGVAKMNLRDYNDAIDDIDKALEIDPNYAEAYCNRGIVKTNLQVYNDAIDDFNMALEIDPSQPNSYFYRGVLRQTLQEFNGAIEDFNRTLELDQDYIVAYYFLGILKKNSREYVCAAEHFNRYIENAVIKGTYITGPFVTFDPVIKPNNTDYYVDSAKEYNDYIEQYLEVENSYIRNNEQNTGPALHFLGWARMIYFQDFNGALEYFNKALEIDPYCRDIHHDIGDVAENIEKANKYLNNIAFFFFDEGIRYAESYNFTEAIEEGFNKAIEIDPTQSDFYLERGKIKRIISDFSGAIDDINIAIELNPKNASAQYFLGVVKLMGFKNYAGALSAFRRTIEINPSFHEYGSVPEKIQMVLGYFDNEDLFYFDSGIDKMHFSNLIGAINDFTKAIEINPNNSNFYFKRGIARRWIGDYAGSLEDLTKAIELEPQNALAYYFRSHIKYYLNDKHGSLADYNKALEIDPSINHPGINLPEF